VVEAAEAFHAGYAGRMMTFGVLAPAFRGAEGQFGLQQFAASGCNFLVEDRCQLHGTGFMPLECRFCHHDRRGQGEQCHRELEEDWASAPGMALIERWMELTGFTGREYFSRLVRRNRKEGR
jgi:hypothetical protein